MVIRVTKYRIPHFTHLVNMFFENIFYFFTNCAFRAAGRPIVQTGKSPLNRHTLEKSENM